MKRTAQPYFALQPDASVHHRHESRANGQTKPCSSILTCHRTVSLRKRLEHLLLFFRWNAYTRVSNGEMQFLGATGVLTLLDSHENLATLREFDGVTHQVHEDLAQFAGIA